MTSDPKRPDAPERPAVWRCVACDAPLPGYAVPQPLLDERYAEANCHTCMKTTLFRRVR